jgi:hypothetical protein
VQEFLVALLVLVPFVPLVKDSRKTNDQQQGDQQHHRIEIRAIGFHFGPAIPAGGKIDGDGNDQQQASGNSDQELTDDLFSTEAVGFPVANEILFPLSDHGANFVIFSRLKSDDLKLPQLLSQYLYQTKKLDLPGIGSFTLDADAVIPQESDRIGQVAATGIRFRNVVVRNAEESLVDFIKEHTGKMKSLAAADLDFYLTTGRQLLNIGKPFYIDGVGTLIKNKGEGFDFTPGDYMIARLDEPRKEGAVYDEPAREREVRGNSTKQGLLLVLIIIGVGVIGWGGYYLYKRNSFSEPEKQAVSVPDTAAPKATAQHAADTTVKTGVKDSVSAGQVVQKPVAPEPSPAVQPAPTAAPTTTAVMTPPPGAALYRFVILSTDNKHHALRRYNQLLGYQLNIKMDEKDSSFFKLYFPIAALPKDTAYIKDSLSDTYAAPHVVIEQ